MNPRTAVTKAIRAHFYPGSFRRLVADLRTGHDDLIVPAEHLTADPLADALDDVMALADAVRVTRNPLDELMRHDDAVAAVYAWAAMSGDNLANVIEEWSR